MIELNSKTQQDFLNREWIQRLLDAGVDMSDAKYCIVYSNGKDYIWLKDNPLVKDRGCLPTYTVSELLNKLPYSIEDCYGEEFYFRIESIENDFGSRGYRVGYYSGMMCIWMSIDYGNLIDSAAETLLWIQTTPKEKRHCV